MKATIVDTDMMHHRRRKRAGRILQKKEELLDNTSNLSLIMGNGDNNPEGIYSSRKCSTLLWKNNQKNNNVNCKKSSSKRISCSTMTHSSLNTWANCLLRNKTNLFLLGLFLTIFSSTSNVQGQPPPLPPAGFLDFDNLPVTRFSCEGKVIGGYYADVETGCQMFHVCTLGQKDEVQDIKFLCLNGTVFDQSSRVCERVEEVDCSKAEEYFDLNLDLYVPHVATPKPADPDLEEEDDNIRPVSTQNPPPPPPTTTIRTTTTTRATTTTTTTPRPRSSSPSSTKSPTKGFSSFNYYLKTPHSHVASGYNSQSRQSYIFNHNPEKEDGNGNSNSYTVNENTGRKIPSGPKTIVYSAISSSSTSRPRTPSRNSVEATTTTQAPQLKPEELDDQYADEYYDDELPLEYDISSSTDGSQQTDSKQNSYELQNNNNNKNSNKNTYQQPQYRGKSSPSSYDYRDGRSTTSSKSRGTNSGSETKSHVSVAVSSSKSTRAPPVIVKTTLKPTPPAPVNNSTEEPYYYDDDYPEDAVQEQPAIIVRGVPSSSTIRSNSGNNLNKNDNNNNNNNKGNDNNGRPTGPSGPTGNGEGSVPSGEGDNPEYYDDGNDNVNVNEHHFTHVDVPRIPFAKPNVPRVLVTNGKPFLPRLRRQSAHHNFSKALSLHQYPSNSDLSSYWEAFVPDDLSSRHRRSTKTNSILISNFKNTNLKPTKHIS